MDGKQINPKILGGKLEELVAQASSVSQSQERILTDLNALTQRTTLIQQQANSLYQRLQEAAIWTENHLLTEPLPPLLEDPPLPPQSEFTAITGEMRPVGNLETNTSKLSQDESELEFNLGTKWFSRIGIGALLVGIAMAINYSFPYFAPWMKILLGWLASGALYGIGTKLYSKIPRLGRVLQVGGFSLGYFSLYAMFFIPGVQLFHSHSVGWTLLAAYVVLSILLSLKINSQTMAIISLVFGYYTASYSGDQTIAFVSTGMLALATVIIAFYRPTWKLLTLIGLLGGLFTALYWNSIPVKEITGIHWEPSLWRQLYLWFLFALFHMASFFPKGKGNITLNILNTLGFFTLYQLTQPNAALHGGTLEVLIATIHFLSVGIASSVSSAEKPANWIYGSLMMGVCFIGLATLDFFHGKILIVTMASEALVLGFLSMHSRYQATFKAISCLFWGYAWLMLLIAGFATDKSNMILSGIWLAMSGLLLEHWVFGIRSRYAGIILFMLSFFGMFFAFCCQLPEQWMTISFVLTAFTFFATGFIWNLRKYRRTALIWLGFAGLNLLFHDIVTLGTPYKIGLFILLGCGLLLASYGYSLLEKHLGEQKISELEEGAHE